MTDNSTKIFGIRAIIEAINGGQTLEKVYIQKGLKGQLFATLNALIKEHAISSSHVPIEKLNHLSKHQNHQGVVAKISPISFHSLETILATKKADSLYLLLDQVTDVRNFGAILRTAECTNVDAIIIPNQGNAPLNADAIKTSAGAAFKIPICLSLIHI